MPDWIYICILLHSAAMRGWRLDKVLVCETLQKCRHAVNIGVSFEREAFLTLIIIITLLTNKQTILCGQALACRSHEHISYWNKLRPDCTLSWFFSQRCKKLWLAQQANWYKAFRVSPSTFCLDGSSIHTNNFMPQLAPVGQRTS